MLRVVSYLCLVWGFGCLPEVEVPKDVLLPEQALEIEKKDRATASVEPSRNPTVAVSPQAEPSPSPSVSPSPTPSPSPCVASRQRTLENWAVYYGYPSSLNSPDFAWTPSLIAPFVSQYTGFVFGDGLQSSSHPDYNPFRQIIQAATHVRLFGYVPLGITKNYSIAQIQTLIADWAAIGMSGVLLDEMGFDFWTDDAAQRTRQNAALDAVHGAGLDAIVNAFDPDDIFVKQSGNPTHMVSTDYYLYESFLFSSTTRETFSFYRTKVQKIKTAKQRSPFKVMTLTTTAESNNQFQQSKFDFVAASTLVDGFDAVSWGTENFSATSALMPYRVPSSSLYQLSFSGNISVSESLQQVSAELDCDAGTVRLDYGQGSVTLPN